MLVGGLNDIRPIVRSLADDRAPPSNQPSPDWVATQAEEIFVGKLGKLWDIMRRKSSEMETADTLPVSRVIHVPALYWHEHDGEALRPDYHN